MFIRRTSPIRKKPGEAFTHFLGRIAVVAVYDVLRELKMFRAAVGKTARISCQWARSQEVVMA